MTVHLLDPRSDDAARTSSLASATDNRLISESDAADSVFLTVRPRLFTIALRVLGDVGEAEDVVQEVWLRWKGADHSVVVNPAAFLAMTTTRLAINVVRSARKRRETSAGPWLPETVDHSTDPRTAAERYEAVDGAVRLLMEKLRAPERAAYLLRKAFDYPYSRISEILHLSEDHARQLVRRGHGRLAGERRQPVDAAAHRRLVRTFLAAAQTGDIAELEDLLAADVGRSPRRRISPVPALHSGQCHQPRL
jgi:RNA polymerase sigma-70 factor (ECF subfamily)